jgi:AmmeMemoRadiSam system protein A
VIALQPEHRTRLLDIARDSIRRALTRQPPSSQIDRDPALIQPAGCFVSLHELANHRLRGCMGRLDAVDPLALAVRRTAINVLSDPRFTLQSVALDELPSLSIEVSVLSPLRCAAGPLDFEPQQQGIYLTVGKRAGCFLPQVARETGWGREQLLARLCSEKLGVPADAWQSPEAKLQVFDSIVIGPEPFEPSRAR